MSLPNETILQVICLFRHGKRKPFLNIDTNEVLSADLSDDSIDHTMSKGKHFIDKYFKVFPSSPFNDKDFKCFISDTSRTIKTVLYRLSELIPLEKDIKIKTQEELKEFTFKTIPNVVYDNKIFHSFRYSKNISNKYFRLVSDFEKLTQEIKEELSKRSPTALELYNKYFNLPFFIENSTRKNFRIVTIYDYLLYIEPEIQKTFTQDQIIMREVFQKLNVVKKLLDYDFYNPNVRICYMHQLMYNYYQEMTKVKENAEDKRKLILFSAHDIYLTGLIKFLEEDNTKYNYSFDDEINFIIFKKDDSDQLYFRAEYNDDPLNIPFSTLNNKKECKLDTLLNKIEKEFLFCTYQEIMDFCQFKNTKEFFPTN